MKYLNYLIIAIGAVVAIYAKAGTSQNEILLVLGIVLLMLGLYNISKTLSSKHAENESDVDKKSNL